MRRWLISLLLLALAACGTDLTAPAPAGPDQGDPVVVFAAASLTEAFASARTRIPQVQPTFNFAGTQQLVTQLVRGAKADVVATADEQSMQRLVDARLVDPPSTLARTTLVIAVGPGNPKRVTGLADLARPELAVVLADPSVPAGRYAANVLATAGVKVAPRSLELDAKAALAKVTSGVADAAIVYATDVRAGAAKAEAVPFPEAADPAATVSYRIAIVSATRQRPAAEAFVASATGGAVRDALLAAGFTA